MAMLLLLPALSFAFKRKARRLPQWRAGDCAFYGSNEFIDHCRKAMEMLNLVDPSMYRLVTSERLGFWHEPRGPAVFSRHFGIPDSYLAWGEQGVIACILYAHFRFAWESTAGLRGMLRQHPATVKRGIESSVQQWLREHSFAPELTASFE